MKVIVSVQSKRGSSRGLVHYVAHSKIDQQKEGSTTRELFTGFADSIDVTHANKLLKSGVTNRRPSNDELHHLVLSLKPEDYEKLGVDEKDRIKSVKEIVRSAMTKFEQAVGAENLTWAASVHRNTNNPHVHIALQKEYFDNELNRKSLSKIPRDCLPHYELIRGEKTFVAGELIEAASQKLDEIVLEKAAEISRINRPVDRDGKERETDPDARDKKRLEIANKTDKNSYERGVLATAILTKFFMERSLGNLDSIVEAGHKRRYVIFDALTQQKRRMSLDDLERRAAEHASLALRKLKLKDAASIAEYRRSLIDAELEQNSNGIRRIRTILLKTASKEQRSHSHWESLHNLAGPEAKKIRDHFRKQNQKLPTPSLTKDELDVLQEKSISDRDVRAVNYFERIRKDLVARHDIPPRTADDIQILRAVQTVQDLQLQFRLSQLKTFAGRRQIMKFEISGEMWSLAKIDQAVRNDSKTSSGVISKIRKILGNKSDRGHDSLRVPYAEIHRDLIEKIEIDRHGLERELAKEKKSVKTIEEICKREPASGENTSAANYSAWQLAEIESLAFQLRVPEAYEQNWLDQKRFITQTAIPNGQHDKPDRSSVKEQPKTSTQENVIAGRAVAREVICQMEFKKMSENLLRFQKSKHLEKFVVLDEKTGESKLVSLRDAEFRRNGSIFDQAIEYITESSERRRTRNTLKTIVKEKESALKHEARLTKELLQIASEEAGDYKKSNLFGRTILTHSPIFTPKETAAVELRIKRTEDRSEAVRLNQMLQLTGDSVGASLAMILANFAPNKELGELRETEIIQRRFSGDPEPRQENQRSDKHDKANRSEVSHEMNTTLPERPVEIEHKSRDHIDHQRAGR